MPPRLSILVRLSGPIKRSHPPSTAGSSNEVKRLRGVYNISYASRPPSEQAIPGEFWKLQTKNVEPFAYCNCPISASSIPVTLLHQIFGKFVDDSRSYEPTKEDNAFVLELSTAMSNFFPCEIARRDTFIDILSRHYNIQLIAGDIGSTGYKTDGHCLAGGYMNLITVAKNEQVSSAGAEPYFQGCSYYRASVKERSSNDTFSVFPCFLLFYCGPFGFAGLASTDRPHLNILGPILPLFYQRHDYAMRETTARFFGAFRNAVHSLNQYYDTELPALRTLDPMAQPNPLYPYKCTYTPLVGTSELHRFKYNQKLSTTEGHSLIFYGETIEPPGINLCIKFVKRYSKDAHLLCAESGYAPTLYGFENLAGDWYMVVMEEIDYQAYTLYCDIQFNANIQYENGLRRRIRAKLLECLHLLHSAGMVHGDVRDTNILVRTDGAFDIKILDFDWAGQVGVVKYPMNVNNIDIKRPATASDGKLVMAEHDIEMVDFMIPPTAIYFGLLRMILDRQEE